MPLVRHVPPFFPLLNFLWYLGRLTCVAQWRASIRGSAAKINGDVKTEKRTDYFFLTIFRRFFFFFFLPFSSVSSSTFRVRSSINTLAPSCLSPPNRKCNTRISRYNIKKSKIGHEQAITETETKQNKTKRNKTNKQHTHKKKKKNRKKERHTIK